MTHKIKILEGIHDLHPPVVDAYVHKFWHIMTQKRNCLW